MRRRSAGVVPGGEVIEGAIARFRALPPDRVIRVLEPLVLASRLRRFTDVIERRLASVTVVLDAPHDPHNGAAVARSCEAFGVHAVHVVESRERFLVARSVARSAEKWIDLSCYEDAETAVRRLRGEGFELVAAQADGELSPEELAGVPRLALVFGNERDGIGAELMAACAKRVRVPMRGFVESLNVSVTAAILLAAATRDRPGDLTADQRRRLYARCLYLSVARADEILAEADPV